jgi:hypothetical protein
MDKLLWVAVVLIIIWVIAGVTKWVAGALLHVLWVVAVILFLVWLVRKIF